MFTERFMRNSGKLLILGIVAAAVLLAGASWWFRYNATHRMAEFWGPDVARRIRDAKRVYISRMNRDAEGAMLTDYTRDVSSAPGLTHLRAALLRGQELRMARGRVIEFHTDGQFDSVWMGIGIFRRREADRPHLFC